MQLRDGKRLDGFRARLDLLQAAAVQADHAEKGRMVGDDIGGEPTVEQERTACLL